MTGTRKRRPLIVTKWEYIENAGISEATFDREVKMGLPHRKNARGEFEIPMGPAFRWHTRRILVRRMMQTNPTLSREVANIEARAIVYEASGLDDYGNPLDPPITEFFGDEEEEEE